MSSEQAMPFELRCPGVLELPDRNIQFFNQWTDEAAPGGYVVMVSISDDETIQMRPGDVVRVGRVDVHLTQLMDPATVRWPVVGEVTPADD